MEQRVSSGNFIADDIKAKLDAAIESVVSEKDMYVKNPGKDFTRKRKLDLETMIHLILGMQGNSLTKELYSFFKFSADPVSVSA